jgi:REP element-mobilizing transposase RayT
MQNHSDTNNIHKSWYFRGYIPHFDQPDLVQFITYRLHDSLPQKVVHAMQIEKKSASCPDIANRKDAATEPFGQYEEYLHKGYGACYLKEPTIAKIVMANLAHFDGTRYRLLAWVIMPNHVHVLIETLEGVRLGSLVHSWKSYTAKEANKILGRSGKFWADDFFDRYIRDDKHFENTLNYIHFNPVTAGLVHEPDDWPFSSAIHWKNA